VQNLARAIVNLRPKDRVGYFGNGLLWDHNAPTYPKYNPVIPFRNRRFVGHGALKSVQVLGADKMGGMVGFFDDQGGQEYFMVVNFLHGATMSKMDGVRTLRLVFDKSVEGIERLNRLTGRVETLRTKIDGDRRVLDVRLEGGAGDLFKWSNGKPWTLRKSSTGGWTRPRSGPEKLAVSDRTGPGASRRGLVFRQDQSYGLGAMAISPPRKACPPRGRVWTWHP